MIDLYFYDYSLPKIFIVKFILEPANNLKVNYGFPQANNDE